MNRIGYIAIALLVWQCQDIRYPEAPDNLIDQATMVDVYTDAYLANASKNFNRTVLLREQVALTEYIYKKYGIDSLQYAQSNAYYSSDLDNYKKMFEQVQENINERFTEVDAIVTQEQERTKRHRDSIREVNKKRRDSLGFGSEDSLEIELQKPIHTQDSLVKPAATKRILQEQITPGPSKDGVLP